MKFSSLVKIFDSNIFHPLMNFIKISRPGIFKNAGNILDDLFKII